MEEQRYQEPHEQYDDIDIIELFKKLLKEWKLILRWCGIAAVVGLIVGFSIPKEYAVTTVLAPEIASKSNSSMSSLASLAGINLGGLNTTDAVYPDLYPNIVSSTPFIVELFSLPVQFTKGKETVSTDLYTFQKEYTRTPWWNYIKSAPMKATGWGLSLFRPKKEKIEGYADVNPEELTPEQGAIAKSIRNSISLSVDKKTSVITVMVTLQNPHVAMTLSEAVVEKLQEYVVSYRTQKARLDLEYYQQLNDEAKAAYYSAQQRYARYVDSNQSVVLQSIRTEQERLQNEMNLNFQLYNSCAQQLQVAKAKVQLETPVCTVINPPEVPLKSTTSKLKTLIVFMFLGVCLAAVWVLWGKSFLAKFKNGDSDRHEEVVEA